MPTKIYLARHGETLWNKTQRLQGQLDSELTSLGKIQSLDVANKLVTKNIDLIISSPLGRALESAYICQEKLQVAHHISANLMERNLGTWQGEEVEKLQRLPEYVEMLNQVTSAELNSAESALSCGHRILNSIKQLANEHLGKNILIIFHGEALRCLLYLLGKKETSNAFNLFKNGCLVTLDYQPKTSYLTMVSE